MANSVASRIGEGNPRGTTHPPHERVRNLEQYPRAVAGARIRGNSATVREIVEELERLVDDVARADAMDVGDEADAAGVVLISWVIQSLLFRHRFVWVATGSIADCGLTAISDC